MNQFLERYKQLGQEFNPEDVKIKNALRINTLKSNEKEVINRLNAKLTKISFLKNGYYYESEFSMAATPEHLQGYYYLQEAASQLPAEILEPKGTDTVLDMCASPGSKTTQLAMLMNNKGKITALDSENVRLPKLQNNLERCGVTNTITYKKDARYAQDLGLEFEKILLDAPCSGNFAIEPDWFLERKLGDIKALVKTQRQLLQAAIDVLKPGGILVYSTCSLEPEENELNINWLLNEYKDVELEKIDIDIGDPGLTKAFDRELNPDLAKCKRFWPHKTGTQGFFLAKLRKLKNL